MDLPRRLLTAVNFEIRDSRTMEVIEAVFRDPARRFNCDSCREKRAVVLRELTPFRPVLLCAEEDEARQQKEPYSYFYALDMSLYGTWSQFIGDRPALYINDNGIAIWDNPTPMSL